MKVYISLYIALVNYAARSRSALEHGVSVLGYMATFKPVYSPQYTLAKQNLRLPTTQHTRDSIFWHVPKRRDRPVATIVQQCGVVRDTWWLGLRQFHMRPYSVVQPRAVALIVPQPARGYRREGRAGGDYLVYFGDPSILLFWSICAEKRLCKWTSDFSELKLMEH